MKRLLITAALAISMITLLAACGGESTEARPSNQESTSGSTGIEPEDTGTSNSIIDPDANVQIYLSLMDDLAIALNTEDLSADSLDEITEIASRLETFSGFFNGLDEAGRDYLFGKYGDELQQTAERVANYAITTQERRGDEAIAQLLAPLPAFAAVTGTDSILEPVLVSAPVVVPPGYIGTLLLPSEVAAFAEGVELTTNYIDRKSMVADVDPSSVEHMDSFDSQIFDTADGSQSFYLSTIKFDSEEAAINHLDLLRSETPGMQDHTTKIGDASLFAEINEFGIGSTVVFKKGFWVVMLHTTQRDGVAPLVDVAGVEALARMVADRL